MSTSYSVKKIHNASPISITVPGSKSITNRALLLASISNGPCLLKGVLFSDDSRAFLDCLSQLGFQMEIMEEKKEVLIKGEHGTIPNKNAAINVRSAGTAARFLTVLLSFAGGCYLLDSSLQMRKRPMEPLLSVLKNAGVHFDFLEEEGHFPFRLTSNGLNPGSLTIGTDISSQFASALLMCANLASDGLDLILSGSRKKGAYIKITLDMIKQFGLNYNETDESIFVPGKQVFSISDYQIEPDVSSAGYFFAMARIMGSETLVRNVHLDSIQGDIKFVKVLETLGCEIQDTKEGIKIRAKKDSYPGIDVDMKDFSDQALTMAAVAVYASTPTTIKHIGHIRFQECDRLEAMRSQLEKLGIRSVISDDFENITIFPGKIKSGQIETFEDHRVAMAFSLIGLRTAGIEILNPDCTGKTFENYFEILSEITK